MQTDLINYIEPKYLDDYCLLLDAIGEVKEVIDWLENVCQDYGTLDAGFDLSGVRIDLLSMRETLENCRGVL